MSNMKCPFCQQKLEIVFQQVGHNLEESYLLCNKCNLRAERKLWQELIKLMEENKCTRKALGVAVDALKMIGSGDIIEHSVVGHEDDNKIFIAKKALEQITALEQKDVK